MKLLWRFQAVARSWGLDRVFWAFLIFAAAMVGYTSVRTRRLERRYQAVRACLAQADLDCAPTSIEHLRSAGADKLRLAIAEADLALLVAKGGPAANLPMEGLDALDPATRADYLLYDGDRLVIAAQFTSARARYAEARGAVPDDLIAPRIARLDDAEKTETARVAAQTEARAAATKAVLDQRNVYQPPRPRMIQAADVTARDLQSAFAEVLTVAQQGSVDKLRLLISDLSPRVQRVVPFDARNKLQLALRAAESAGNSVRRREDTHSVQDTWTSFGKSNAEIEYHRRYTAAMDTRRDQMIADLQRSIDENLSMGRRLVAEAVAMAPTGQP